MAKSTTRGGRVEKRSSARSTKTTEIEVVEEASGLGFEGGVAIITALLIVAALVMVDMELGATGHALLFKP
jgi:hypothetical protein